MRTVQICLLALGLLASQPQVCRAETVLGTGSAFAHPIYGKWAELAKTATGVELNYQGVGSGVGQNQILSGLTDFGATDVPMDEDKLRRADILQFPTVAGGYVVFVNLPGVQPNQLKLTGPVLADIFMGGITRWNDPQIAALNPDLVLPKTAIAPLYHAADSGGTYALSRYLGKVSEAWRSKMGVGMSLKWPTGSGVRGSYGAASTGPTLLGSIGYAEASYAASSRLSTVRLQNKAGAFVAPGADSFASAVEHGDWGTARNGSVDLTDTPGPQSWPIVTATFVLVPRAAAPDKTRAVLALFGWAFAHGDDAAEALQYVPLPKRVKTEVEASWGKEDATR